MTPGAGIYQHDIFDFCLFAKYVFSVEVLWTGLISALLKHAGSKHNSTFPLALDTKTKTVAPL